MSTRVYGETNVRNREAYELEKDVVDDIDTWAGIAVKDTAARSDHLRRPSAKLVRPGSKSPRPGASHRSLDVVRTTRKASSVLPGGRVRAFATLAQAIAARSAVFNVRHSWGPRRGSSGASNTNEESERAREGTPAATEVHAAYCANIFLHFVLPDGKQMHGVYGGTRNNLVDDVDEVMGYLEGMTKAPSLVVPEIRSPPELRSLPRYERPPLMTPPPSLRILAPRIPLFIPPQPTPMPPVPQSLIDADVAVAAAVPPARPSPAPLPQPQKIRLLGLNKETVESLPAAVETFEVDDSGPGLLPPPDPPVLLDFPEQLNLLPPLERSVRWNGVCLTASLPIPPAYPPRPRPLAPPPYMPPKLLELPAEPTDVGGIPRPGYVKPKLLPIPETPALLVVPSEVVSDSDSDEEDENEEQKDEEGVDVSSADVSDSEADEGIQEVDTVIKDPTPPPPAEWVEPPPLGWLRGRSPVFVVDMSGTMAKCGREEALRETLKLLLSPEGELVVAAAAFDIVVYGPNQVMQWSAVDGRARRAMTTLEAELDEFLNRTYDVNASKFRHPGQEHKHKKSGKCDRERLRPRSATALHNAGRLNQQGGGRPMSSREHISARAHQLGQGFGVPPPLPPLKKSNARRKSEEEEEQEDGEVGVVRADMSAINRAAAWIASLPKCHGPSNATAAVRAALNTPGADVVWWLSDGLPDNRQTLFKLLTYPSRERLPALPLHVLGFEPTPAGEATLRKALTCSEMAAAANAASHKGRRLATRLTASKQDGGGTFQVTSLMDVRHRKAVSNMMFNSRAAAALEVHRRALVATQRAVRYEPGEEVRIMARAAEAAAAASHDGDEVLPVLPFPPPPPPDKPPPSKEAERAAKARAKAAKEAKLKAKLARKQALALATGGVSKSNGGENMQRRERRREAKLLRRKAEIAEVDEANKATLRAHESMCRELKATNRATVKRAEEEHAAAVAAWDAAMEAARIGWQEECKDIREKNRMRTTMAEEAHDVSVRATRAMSKEADADWAAVVHDIRSKFHDGIKAAAEVNLRRVALTLVCYAQEVNKAATEYRDNLNVYLQAHQAFEEENRRVGESNAAAIKAHNEAVINHKAAMACNAAHQAQFAKAAARAKREAEAAAVMEAAAETAGGAHTWHRDAAATESANREVIDEMTSDWDLRFGNVMDARAAAEAAHAAACAHHQELMAAAREERRKYDNACERIREQDAAAAAAAAAAHKHEVDTLLESFGAVQAAAAAKWEAVCNGVKEGNREIESLALKAHAALTAEVRQYNMKALGAFEKAAIAERAAAEVVNKASQAARGRARAAVAEIDRLQRFKRALLRHPTDARAGDMGVGAAAIMAALHEAQYAGASQGVVLSSGGEVEALLHSVESVDRGTASDSGPARYLAELAAGLWVCPCCAVNVIGDEAEMTDLRTS